MNLNKQTWIRLMKTELNICILAALLVCHAENVPSAEAKKQRVSAASESATTSPRESQPPSQEDLGCVVIDGKTNKVIRVHSADPISVFVLYESEECGRGGRKIPRKELPPQLQAKYPYDAAKAAEYRKQQADAAAEQAALSVQQAARMRAAAKEVLGQKERGILAQIGSLNKKDVELQKEKSVLNSLPAGNGRRVRARHISDEQQSIREQIAQLRKQVEQIRVQSAGTP
jgi:hypothetical protein